jgi:hypothetical protein
MKLETTSFAFSHANMQNDFSLFMQSKLSFKVISWCSGCLSGFFIGFRISLEFSELICWNKHQFDFFFCIKTLISQKILVKIWGHACFFGKKEKNTKEFLVQWFCE